ncbi:MAG TPA: VWA domain-containing protein [Spirochaetia bacterium]
MKTVFAACAALLLLCLLITGCGNGRDRLVVLSGSENETLEPLLKDFTQRSGIDVTMTYKGSVDIMLALQDGAAGYDAVWPANTLWISLGDTRHKVKLAQSIMTSPVAFGIRTSKARELGFVGRDVYVADIARAIEGKKLTFAMTSASQSNSGACAYLGFISALLGNPDVIRAEDLRRPDLVKGIRTLLAGINRSSGSSAWLKDLFLESSYDAMVNYEALLIETNIELVKEGKEPLYVVYPVDGIVMADSPLGYVNNEDARKEAAFRKLQDYLLSSPVQEKIAHLGRRTGVGGLTRSADPSVFNKSWGIDTDRVLSPRRLPAAEVITEALTLYQTEFRKPSLTVFCLDYSGSMEGKGSSALKDAMGLLLDQEKAARFLLQPGKDDQIIVIPFSTRPIDTWRAAGGSHDELVGLQEKIDGLTPTGSTDVYSAVMEGMSLLSQRPDIDSYIPAIVLMTDGRSNTGRTIEDMKDAFAVAGRDIPVFCIMFGDASEKQLDQIARLTHGRVFDGRSDLAGAFRSVRGYN